MYGVVKRDGLEKDAGKNVVHYIFPLNSTTLSRGQRSAAFLSWPRDNSVDGESFLRCLHRLTDLSR